MKHSKKNLLAGAVLLASMGMGLQSCGKVDNPLDVVVTPTPETKEVKIEKNDDGATITVFVPSDITEVLSSLSNDNEIKTGEQYTVDVKATGLETTGTDFTISVPKVTNSDVVLNFENEISTEKPLVVKAAESESETSTDKVNDLTITMPNITEDKAISLEVKMPETTVTLATSGTETVYDEVTALTAKQTLYIDKGVTVKKLRIEGGTVVVKDGGKVEGVITDQDITVNANGVILAPVEIDGEEVQPLTDENGETYYAKNLKVIKGEGDYVEISLSPNEPDGDGFITMEKLTVAADAAAMIRYWYDQESKAKIDVIEGEGEQTAKVYLPYFYLYDNVKKVSNIIVEGRVHSDVETININHLEAENCTFRNYEYIFYYNAPKLFKGCKFETEIDEEGKLNVGVPHQSEENPSYEVVFEDCEFSDNFRVIPDIEKYMPDGNTQYTFDNYIVTFTFKDCKQGGNPLTTEIDKLIGSYWSISGCKFIFNIDGKEYIY